MSKQTPQQQEAVGKLLRTLAKKKAKKMYMSEDLKKLLFLGNLKGD